MENVGVRNFLRNIFLGMVINDCFNYLVKCLYIFYYLNCSLTWKIRNEIDAYLKEKRNLFTNFLMQNLIYNFIVVFKVN